MPEKNLRYILFIHTRHAHFAIHAHVTELYLSICVYSFTQKHNTIVLGKKCMNVIMRYRLNNYVRVFFPCVLSTRHLHIFSIEHKLRELCKNEKSGF